MSVIKKLTILQRFTYAVLLFLLIASCSGISKATDIFVKPTAKEIYLRELKSPQLLELWEEQADLALLDSVSVNTPYSEAGRFFPKTFPVYSYEVALNPGEKLQVEVDSGNHTIHLFAQDNLEVAHQQRFALQNPQMLRVALGDAEAGR